MDIEFNKREDQNKLKWSEINRIFSEIKKGGGEKRLQKLRDEGKMIARERIEYLLDKNEMLSVLDEIEFKQDLKSYTAKTNVESIYEYDNEIEKYENITKPFIETKGLKFPQLFQPIRIALTGGTQAPSVYDILFILDFAESKIRISKALEKNFKNSWFKKNIKA